METEKLKVSVFKVWLVANGIRQRKLSKDSKLGITTLHNMINNGECSKKTIKQMSLCLRNKFGKDLSEEELSKMITTFE